MEASMIAERLAEWIRIQTTAAGARGVVLGISGGIDSAVVAGLAVRAFPDTTLGICLPCQTRQEDIDHADLAAKAIGFEYRTVDLLPVYDCFKSQLAGDGEHHALALANIKPRLRMTTLYYYAQQRNYLVLGTGNRSELTIGYFTKYGDGGADLLPIGGLVKAQVVELAKHLGVPEPIINKPPSAGLWEGQTDEGEIGISYADLDQYILLGKGSNEVKDKVDKMRITTEHKRSPIPIGVF